MIVDTVEIAGMRGIQVPDDVEVGSEFTLEVRVRVFDIKRNEINVTGYSGDKRTVWPETLPGPLLMQLVAV